MKQKAHQHLHYTKSSCYPLVRGYVSECPHLVHLVTKTYLALVLPGSRCLRSLLKRLFFAILPSLSHEHFTFAVITSLQQQEIKPGSRTSHSEPAQPA